MPRYDPHTQGEHSTTTIVEQLYLLMGKELVPVPEAKAGRWLQAHVYA
jgi:translation elongation factor EF-G